MKIPCLIAHRGYMARFPENTIEGIEAALVEGAPFVELDVQSLTDGTLVLFHDSTLQRTTGIEGDLFQLTPSALKNFNACEPARLGQSAHEFRIPLLEDLVQLMLRYPGSEALVEIKPESLIRFGLQPVIERLLRTLDPIIERVVIISFRSGALAYLHRLAPKVRIGLVLRRVDTERARRARRLNPDFLIASQKLLPPVPPPWSGDWRWAVYDVTDPELALRYGEVGIELVETGDIGGMLRHPLLALKARKDGRAALPKEKNT